MKTFFLPIFILLSMTIVWAQPANDDCEDAILLTDVTDWCSEDEAYNNIDATPSGYGPASCWGAGETGVWFRFTAVATDVVITVIGNSSADPGGTLELPQVALYNGVCGGTINELQCGRDMTFSHIIEINTAGLVLGEEYLIRVNGTNESTGTFQLCVNNFNPPVFPGQDCNTASVLCDKSPFSIEVVQGAGVDPDEADGTCLGTVGGRNSEQQSTWYRWTAANNGNLTFTITPNNPGDDLDFVLYELPNGSCASKEAIRCMATACLGPTGLSEDEDETVEDLNCDAGENGFVSDVQMTAGTEYVLMINNFSTTGNGYSISWGGTGEFLGPQAQFRVEPDAGLRCEEDFVVIDESSFSEGNIVSWSWNFGEDASPQTASGPGPHNVVYGSIGTKFLALTIEVDLGCVVTDVRQVEVEPCCEDVQDPDDFMIDPLDVQDILCAGDESGAITLNAVGGTPEFEYSVNGSDFREIFFYDDLAAGEYEVIAIDAHGCLDTLLIPINEPEPIVVDLGPDQLVDLGFSTVLDATINPPDDYDIQWCPTEGIADTTSTMTEVTPPGRTVYTLKAVNEDGCIGMDSVLLDINDEKPIYIPNVFSPNFDGLNDQIVIYGNRAAEIIEEFQIFDRWGNLVYHARNVPLGAQGIGWDGRFKGEPVNPGVFVIVAQVRFIDNQSVVFTQDLTVVR